MATEEPMIWSEDALGFGSDDQEEDDEVLPEEPAPKPLVPTLNHQEASPTNLTSQHTRSGSSDIIMQHANYSYNNLSLANGGGKSSTSDKVLNIIARELGISKANLLDSYCFEEDLGLDLYSSFEIIGLLREELELYTISNDLFSEYTTVGQLKQYLTALDSSVVTPLSQIWDISDDEISTAVSSPPNVSQDLAEKYTKIARNIVARELDLSSAATDCDRDLEDMGMDSLLALVILGELREATELYDLPSNFLTRNTTINAIGLALAYEVKVAR